MMMQKGDPYTKLLVALSGVRLMSCILSELNILCSSQVKPYYTKTTIHPLFTVHTLRPYSRVFQRISSKRSDLYIKAFSTLSGVKTVFLILMRLNILCTIAVKRYYT